MWVCNELQHTKTTVPTLWFSLSLISSLLMHFLDLTHSLLCEHSSEGQQCSTWPKILTIPVLPKAPQGLGADLTTKNSAWKVLSIHLFKKPIKTEVQGWKIYHQHPTTTVSYSSSERWQTESGIINLCLKFDLISTYMERRLLNKIFSL